MECSSNFIPISIDIFPCTISTKKTSKNVRISCVESSVIWLPNVQQAPCVCSVKIGKLDSESLEFRFHWMNFGHLILLVRKTAWGTLKSSETQLTIIFCMKNSKLTEKLHVDVLKTTEKCTENICVWRINRESREVCSSYVGFVSSPIHEISEDGWKALRCAD